MVAESSFATRLPVADGFKAIGGGGEEGVQSARTRAGREGRRWHRGRWTGGEEGEGRWLTMAKRRTKPIHG